MKEPALAFKLLFTFWLIIAGGCTTPFVKAGCDGDEAMLISLLEKGADINESYAKKSALSCAIQKNKEATALMLLSKGADPNTPPGYYSPLVNAVISGQKRIVNELLAHGADPNDPPSYYSPLVFAVTGGHVEIVNDLLAKGANPNNPSGSYSPIMYAADKGYLDILKALIKHKVNVESKSMEGLTPLGRAASKGNYDAVKILIEGGADIDAALTSLDVYLGYYQKAWAAAEVQIGKGLLQRYLEKFKPPHIVVSNGYLTTEGFKSTLVNIGQSAIVETEGTACMSDDRSKKQTMALADTEAKRKANELVLTRIKSDTEVQNGALSKDLVQAYSNSDVKVINELAKGWYRDSSFGDCYRVVLKLEVIPATSAKE